MRAPHKQVHADCPYGRTWADCDKKVDDIIADVDAFKQVMLAYRIVVAGRAGNFRRENSQFAQLVLYIAGEKRDILNDDGNPSRTPWVMRLRRAIDRVIAGDFPPGYTYQQAQ